MKPYLLATSLLLFSTIIHAQEAPLAKTFGVSPSISYEGNDGQNYYFDSQTYGLNLSVRWPLPADATLMTELGYRMWTGSISSSYSEEDFSSSAKIKLSANLVSLNLGYLYPIIQHFHLGGFIGYDHLLSGKSKYKYKYSSKTETEDGSESIKYDKFSRYSYKARAQYDININFSLFFDIGGFRAISKAKESDVVDYSKGTIYALGANLYLL